ncbi:MAG: cadherin-like domain-containing protein [Pseudomonadota bacterium]
MADFVVNTNDDEEAETTDLDTETGDGNGLSLREAIALANETEEADTITFDIDGGAATIFLENLTDFGDIEITEALTIDGDGLITLDGALNERIFEIAADTAVTLMGLTLRDGNPNDGEGGGAVRSLSDLTVDGVTFTGNGTTAGGEGGALLVEGDLTLSNANFDGNDTAGVGGSGGAVAVRGDATITDTAFTNNETTGGGADGGALFVTGTLDVTGGSFTSNLTEGADARGGAIFAGGLLDLDGVLISSNRTEGARSTGGGVHADGGANIAGGAFDSNTTTGEDASGGGLYVDGALSVMASGIDAPEFTENLTGVQAGTGEGARGGAIFVAGDADFDDALFDGNGTGGADAAGGALAVTGALTTIDTAFTDNVTDGENSQGGAVFAGSAEFTTTRFEGNETTGDGAAGGAVYSDGAVDLTTSFLVDNLTRGDNAAGGAIRAGSLDIANGGADFTGNETLGAMSPGGLAAVFGALSVSNANLLSNATSGDDSEGGTFYATGTVDIASVVVSGSETGGARSEGGALFAGGAATVISATFSDNRTTGEDAKGGAIATDSTIVIDASTLERNTTSGEGATGGGLSSGGDAWIVATTLSSNGTTGASARGGGANSEADLTLLNSTVSGNSTTGSFSLGGGIAVETLAVVANTSVVANTTAGSSAGGGGIYAAGDITLLKATVTGNLTSGASSPGGGINFALDRLFGDSIVTGNAATGSAEITNDVAVGASSAFAEIGDNLIGPADAPAEAVFSQTVTIAPGIEAGVLAANGGQVATVDLLDQGSNLALDRGVTLLLDEALRGVDLNGDGDQEDLFQTDARGTGFARDVDLAGVGRDSAGFGDLGAIEASGANRQPIAQDDLRTLNEDSGPVTIDLLLNDSDLDPGTTLIVTSIDDTDVVGEANLSSNGQSLIYDPSGQFGTLPVGDSAQDIISYTISDQEGGTATAQAIFTITGLNDAPRTIEDTGQIGALAGETSFDVLMNDVDVDEGDTIALSDVDLTETFGTARISDDGSTLLYDPNGAFDNISVGGTAVDTVGYTIRDTSGATATGTLTLTVVGEASANTPPVAVDDFGITTERAAIELDLLTGSGADSDPDGDALSIASLSSPANGLVVLQEDGTVLYRPREDFVGNDSFDYEVEDGRGGIDTGTVTVTVSEDPGTTSLPLGDAQTVAFAYEAGLDRDGNIDLPGLNFWIGARADGLSEDDLAQAFLDSPEFEASFGDPDTLSDRELVEQFYLNVLNRAGEEGGINFWETALSDPNFDRNDLLIAFADSPENLLGSPEVTTLTEVSPGMWDFV